MRETESLKFHARNGKLKFPREKREIKSSTRKLKFHARNLKLKDPR